MVLGDALATGYLVGFSACLVRSCWSRACSGVGDGCERVRGGFLCADECVQLWFEWCGARRACAADGSTLRSGGTVASEVYLRRGYC